MAYGVMTVDDRESNGEFMARDMDRIRRQSMKDFVGRYRAYIKAKSVGDGADASLHSAGQTNKQ